MRQLIVTAQIIAPWFFSVFAAVATFNAMSFSDDALRFTIRILVSSGVFFFGFPLIAGALSIPYRNGIRDSLLPRTLSNNTYFIRRMHSACWTNLYYFTPAYQVVLAIPFLAKPVFRLFGYTGSMEVALFPDTWIRDLPLLKVAKGAYMANKSTVGTNLCLANGKILVQSVEIGEGAILGHLAAVGPGVKLGAKSQVGVNCGVGVRTKLADNVDVGLYGFVHHGVSIGANTTVGAHTFIGLRAKIGEGLTIPAGANIPGGAVILTRDDLDKHLRTEKSDLAGARMAAVTELATGIKTERGGLSAAKALEKAT